MRLGGRCNQLLEQSRRAIEVFDDGEERPPELPLDLPAVEAAVKERGARLLVIATDAQAGRRAKVPAERR